ncbi:MAG: hypothetical protein EP329_07820 [Deltaproteobacteria bacterium]|nr:MAG: hypothetical protein EP329_07820 [Deltaproteobacteria bacterium]
MTFTAGYLHWGRYRGAPLRLHWSLPLGMVALSGFAFAPLAWLAVLALVLVHEAGHASAIKRYNLRIVGVDLHGLGGETHWLGRPTLRQRVAIAWAGVMAQLVAFVVVALLNAAFGPAHELWLQQVVSVYTTGNLIMMALNLLPLPGLDGELAWMILPGWRRRAQQRVDARLHRVNTLHIVRRDGGKRPTRRDMADAVADVDRELRAITEAHNAAAASGDDDKSPGRDGAGSKTRR